MLLRELTALRGPSGHEHEVRDALRKEAGRILEGKEGRVYTDTMGNLYAYRKGTDPKKEHVMLAAHMDEVGFIVTFVSDNGLLHIDCVGGVDPRCCVSKRVLVGDKAVPGVLGIKAIHLMSPEDRKKAPDYSTLTIDIGCESKEEAERLCPPGSYVTFESEYREFGNGMVKARAIDDRMGCMILLDIMENCDYAGDMTCVFTVQEEVGLRGAKVAARRVKPDRAIIIDTTACNDMGMVDSHKQSASCGGGAALTFMDRRIIVPKAFRELAMNAAKARGIPVQIKRGSTGGTDAGEIHKSMGGIPCLAIVLPCRYAHSPANVASLSDIKAVRDLTFAVMDELDKGDGFHG
ncbi:MAG: M20/M25/M40 family metallo-hydrolase [Clostridia bacterium]|nr:M20/M25/M40 family metallo-hydrolase [Clostridia bacterium]